MVRPGRIEPDLRHGIAEEFAVLGLVDRGRGRADEFDVVLGERSHLLEGERAVQRRLPAHGRQQREPARHGAALGRDDLGHHLGRDRLDVGPVRHVRVGHDGGGVRVDQHDAIAVLAERLAGLGSRIVELASLPDDDRAGPDDHDRGDVLALRHRRSWWRRWSGHSVEHRLPPGKRRSGRRGPRSRIPSSRPEIILGLGEPERQGWLAWGPRAAPSAKSSSRPRRKRHESCRGPGSPHERQGRSEAYRGWPSVRAAPPCRTGDLAGPRNRRGGVEVAFRIEGDAPVFQRDTS